MDRIVILADEQADAKQIREMAGKYYAGEKKMPYIETYDDSDVFFREIQRKKPYAAIVAVRGIPGLNAAEHTKALCPECKLIWCSDMEFSLQAYRIRAVYFLMYPLREDELAAGLARLYPSRP